MNIKFFHNRILRNIEGDISTHGGATVAFVDTTPERKNDEKHLFHYAYAWCRENENFNKKIGRDVASGRLKANKYNIMECLPGLLYDEVF